MKLRKYLWFPFLLQRNANWMLPGTLIVTDGWVAYSNLKKEGYMHEIVNHLEHFVDLISIAYTQNIERKWRDARAHVFKYGRRDKNISASIWQFILSKIPKPRRQIPCFLVGCL